MIEQQIKKHTVSSLRVLCWALETFCFSFVFYRMCSMLGIWQGADSAWRGIPDEGVFESGERVARNQSGVQIDSSVVCSRGLSRQLSLARKQSKRSLDSALVFWPKSENTLEKILVFSNQSQKVLQTKSKMNCYSSMDCSSLSDLKVHTSIFIPIEWFTWVLFCLLHEGAFYDLSSLILRKR